MLCKQLISYSVLAAISILFAGCGGQDNYTKPTASTIVTEYIFKSYFPKNKDSCVSLKVKNYVGSENCKVCHNNQYKTWKKYYMSHFVKLRKDIKRVPVDWYSSPTEIRNKKEGIVIVVNGKQTVAIVAKPWEVLPYQYVKGKENWRYRKRWTHSDYRYDCGGCHLTGLDKNTLEFSELGVGCEACHGPGKHHVDNPKLNHIFVPKGNEACKTCHFQGIKHSKRFNFSGIFHK